MRTRTGRSWSLSATTAPLAAPIRRRPCSPPSGANSGSSKLPANCLVGASRQPCPISVHPANAWLFPRQGPTAVRQRRFRLSLERLRKRPPAARQQAGTRPRQFDGRTSIAVGPGMSVALSADATLAFRFMARRSCISCKTETKYDHQNSSLTPTVRDGSRKFSRSPGEPPYCIYSVADRAADRRAAILAGLPLPASRCRT